MSGDVTSRRFVAGGRALAPVAGALLLAVTVVVASVAAAALVAGVGATDLSSPATAALTCSADADSGTLSLTHRGGTALTPATLRLRVSVDGDPLAHQPPVPFFAARGFESGPTGPFNRGWAGRWTAGTAASLALAGTNSELRPGDSVRLRLWSDDDPVADCTTTA